MTDKSPRNGDVIRYSYLWRREFARDEESGRKARPVCVAVLLGNAPDRTRVALFPITSQPPQAGRVALAIPEMEARRARIRAPAWIILDECNADIWEISFHIEDTKTFGRFSYAFFERIRDTALKQLRAGRLQPVPRR